MPSIMDGTISLIVKTFYKLCLFYRYEIWKQIIELSDPQGEQNAYKILGVGPSSSQSEIKSKWKALSREFHPDKVKDPELQHAAQEKFMEIQQAYEILSKIKSKRSRKNQKSIKDSEL